MIEWAYGEYEYLGIVGEREIKNILRMRRVVIGLLSVNALMILAQISSGKLGFRQKSETIEFETNSKFKLCNVHFQLFHN